MIILLNAEIFTLHLQTASKHKQTDGQFEKLRSNPFLQFVQDNMTHNFSKQIPINSEQNNFKLLEYIVRITRTSSAM